MVDPVDLAFGEVLGKRGVQRFRALQITTERLLDDDPRGLRRDPEAVKPLGEIAEKRWRNGKIEGLHHVLAHQPREVAPARVALRIDRHIVQMAQEPGQRLAVGRRILAQAIQ